MLIFSIRFAGTMAATSLSLGRHRICLHQTLCHLYFLELNEWLEFIQSSTQVVVQSECRPTLMGHVQRTRNTSCYKPRADRLRYAKQGLRAHL